MARVLGVGLGLFCVLLSFGICVLISLTVYAMRPALTPIVAIASLALPAVVFALFAAAAQKGEENPNELVDKMYPVRILFIVVLAAGAIGGQLAMKAIPLLTAPPFEAPRSQCRRKQLETFHPSWVR